MSYRVQILRRVQKTLGRAMIPCAPPRTVSARIWVSRTIISAAVLGGLLAPSCRKQSPEAGSGPSGSAEKHWSWVLQYRPPASAQPAAATPGCTLNAISVVSPSVVFVAADFPDPKDPRIRSGVVLKTADGGSSWSESPITAPDIKALHLSCIRFLSSSTGWVVGSDDSHRALAFRTTDAGATWSRSLLPNNLTPTSAYLDANNVFWVCGLVAEPARGKAAITGSSSGVFSSADQGATWAAQYKFPVAVNSLSFVDGSTGWGAGNAGSVFHTTDGGRTWQQQTTGLERGLDLPGIASMKKISLSSVTFCDPAHGWAAGISGEPSTSVIIATSDGGQTWALQWFGKGASISDILFLNPSEGWAVSSRGTSLYHSSDGGRNWDFDQSVAAEQRPQLYRIGAADADHIWAVGPSGIFFRKAE
jgi:photosystem II stability/assembly factor-like uncharacterized protein